MSILTKLFGKTSKGVADAMLETAKGVSDIVERWKPSDAAEHQMKQEANAQLQAGVSSARQYDPRTSASNQFVEVFNAVIDGVARLIRPGLTILIVGAVFGWWRVETQSLDPLVLAWGEAVGAFWFGMRAITKDIPSLIKMLVELKRKS